MKRTIILIGLSIGMGVFFTFFVLNKGIYAKEEYTVYAFQVGTFTNNDDAINKLDELPSGIVIKNNNEYEIYVALYKDLEIVNKMVEYYNENNINIYLKMINVNKEFYNILDNYEEIIRKSTDNTIYDKVNQSVLKTYNEVK